MKKITHIGSENNSGRFVWKEIPDGYKSSAEIDSQKNEYAKLWEKTKSKLDELSDETVLNGISTEKDFEKNIGTGKEFYISSQISKMLGETGSWAKMSDFPKTKFVMKKLTEKGFKINNPKDFIGKKLVIKNGEISVEKSVSGKKVEKDPEESDDQKSGKSSKQKTETLNSETEKQEELNIQEGGETQALEDLKKNQEENKKQIEEVETEISKKESPVVEPEKIEDLTTKILSPDFLTENVTTEELKKEIEPEIQKLKKTPEQRAELLGNFEKLNQDFRATSAAIKKALEGTFEKGKLKNLTPEQMENLLQKDSRYEKLYAQMQPEFGRARELQKQIAETGAVLAVDALVDENYKSRFDVFESDAQDVPTDEKTDFGKKYEIAEEFFTGSNSVDPEKIENYEIFTEMQHGVARARNVVLAKNGMEKLAELDAPVAEDFEKIQTIKKQIAEAREHGPINEMFGENELVNLLEKEDRSAHMLAKKNIEETFADVPKVFQKKIENLTKEFLDKNSGNIATTISILSTAMTHEFNKEKDPETEKEDGRVWDSKHLDQTTANGIEALILRKTQLDGSAKFADKVRNLNPDFFVGERRKLRDRVLLSKSEIENFQKLESEFNSLVLPYEGKPDLLLNDIEVRLSSVFLKKFARARENVNAHLNLPEMSEIVPVEPKVEISGKTLKFKKVKKSSGAGKTETSEK
ncbi:hypothetical protein HN954_00335 [bacterium]|jgi:hypothetical protein|nr:hypothetical protein [bacterium]MBT6832081.1 hypothetical protein [bacterium]MBT6995862.1 hypothetical protein [bacterium]MBT7772613.1 hypothetical protein [bacterium]